MQFIPMLKESIFEEEQEIFSTVYITTDFNSWVESKRKDRLKHSGVPGQGEVSDFDAGLELFAPELKKVKFFMLRPVAKFGYDTIESRTFYMGTTDVHAVENLQRLVLTHGDRLFLYDLDYVSNPKVVAKAISGGEADGPIENWSCWKIRYGLLPEVALTKKIDDVGKYVDTGREPPVLSLDNTFVPL